MATQSFDLGSNPMSSIKDICASQTNDVDVKLVLIFDITQRYLISVGAIQQDGIQQDGIQQDGIQQDGIQQDGIQQDDNLEEKEAPEDETTAEPEAEAEDEVRDADDQTEDSLFSFLLNKTDDDDDDDDDYATRQFPTEINSDLFGSELNMLALVNEIKTIQYYISDNIVTSLEKLVYISSIVDAFFEKERQQKINMLKRKSDEKNQDEQDKVEQNNILRIYSQENQEEKKRRTLSVLDNRINDLTKYRHILDRLSNALRLDRTPDNDYLFLRDLIHYYIVGSYEQSFEIPEEMLNQKSIDFICRYLTKNNLTELIGYIRYTFFMKQMKQQKITDERFIYIIEIIDYYIKKLSTLSLPKIPLKYNNDSDFDFIKNQINMLQSNVLCYFNIQNIDILSHYADLEAEAEAEAEAEEYDDDDEY
jgi:hypothetical protein